MRGGSGIHRLLDEDEGAAFPVYVKVVSGRAVGAMSVRKGKIELVYVDPAFRRQGVASELLAEARKFGSVEHSDSRTPLGAKWAASHGAKRHTDRSDQRSGDADGQDMLEAARKRLNL